MKEIDVSFTNTSSAREIDLNFTNTSSAWERLTLVLLILALHAELVLVKLRPISLIQS
jgi:hypothetical protein